MELKVQPEGSSTCGHHCLAMLTNKPVEEIIKLIGHTHGTYTRELVKVLNGLGIILPKAKMTRLSKRTDLSKGVYVLSVKWLTKGYHWVVLSEDFIYDPGAWHSGIYTYSEYLEFIADKGRITSYLKIY